LQIIDCRLPIDINLQFNQQSAISNLQCQEQP
jgi:hypothetical protein